MADAAEAVGTTEPAALEKDTTPPGRVSVGDSVRAAIAKSEVAPKAEPKPEPAAPKDDGDQPRQANGKFAKKDGAEPQEQPKAASAPVGEVEGATVAPEAPPRPAIRAPQGLKSELKGEWGKLDPKWQGEIDRLERAAKAGIERHAGMANVGQALMAEIRPYEQMIRGAGATPQQAVRELFRTEYQLRTGTPAQKAQLIYRLAQHYGIDLSGISQGQVPQVDPNVAALTQQMQSLQQQIQHQAAQRTNAESAQVTGTISEFAADPKHEHFEDVRVQMGVLIESGAAQTLDEAYEQACWANPTIRAKLIESQAKEAEAKRAADERKRVEAAKAAAVSVKGAPAAPIAAVPGKKESVGDTIRRVSAQAANRI